MASEAAGQLHEFPALIRIARLLAAFLCFITLLSPANAFARDHYVDAARGDDRNDGLTPASAWRSLAQVRQASLEPGDRVLMMAGSVWNEPLEIRRSGGRKAPIIFTTFGTGPRPRIDVGGRFDYGVAILNAEYVEVGGLEVTNQSEAPSLRYGVLISQKDAGVARNIAVRDMYIHDIHGTNDRKDNGGIVFQALATTRSTRFQNLVIERNIIWRVDRSGIAGISDQVTPDRWFPSEGVVIRDNYLDDIGGDGIVPRGTDGALIEHNIVYRAAARAPGYKVAIWQWSTDNTLIQLNEVGFTHGRWDGQGFDSDFNSRRTTIAYNFSHDNEGGFVLICSPDRARADNLGNVGTVVSGNVSRHDGARIVQLAGPISHVRMEGNVIYVGKEQDVTMIAATHWDGWASDISFSNNKFAVAGTARYGHEIGRDGPHYLVAAGFPHSPAIRFEGNRFLGRHVDPPEDSRGIWKPEYQDPVADWSVPTFDPAVPIDFDAYLTNHRTWMMTMLARELGQRVKLLVARRSSWMEARPRSAP